MRGIPGNEYEFTQPVQMRMNELIAGVRADVAIKVFGDDMAVLAGFGEQIEAIAQQVAGAADVKLEQVTGLPMLTVTPDRAALARYGLSLDEVQDAISIAMAGGAAGQLFEGDRRFDIVVRLPEALRTNLDRLAELPISLPLETAEGHVPGQALTGAARYVPLGELVLPQVLGPDGMLDNHRGARHGTQERDAGGEARRGGAVVVEEGRAGDADRAACRGQRADAVSLA